MPLTAEVFAYMDKVAPASATSLIGDLAAKENLAALRNALAAGCANGETHSPAIAGTTPVKRSTKVRMKAIIGMMTKAHLAAQQEVRDFVAKWIRESGMGTPQFLSRHLYKYIKNEHVDAIRVLVDAGAKPLIVLGKDPEDGEMRGYSPLAYAISNRYPRAFMALLRDHLKEIPSATRSPDQDIISTMCRADAIPSAMFLSARDALFERLPQAVVQARLEVLGREVMDEQPGNEFVIQALAMGAVLPDRKTSWRELIDRPISLYKEDPVPLLRYLTSPRTTCALTREVLGRMLDEQAISPNHVFENANLLQHAVIGGDLQMATLLIERGADPGIKTADGLDVVQLNREHKDDPELQSYLEAAVAMAAVNRVLARRTSVAVPGPASH
jgi:hypothetical protein